MKRLKIIWLMLSFSVFLTIDDFDTLFFICAFAFIVVSIILCNKLDRQEAVLKSNRYGK